MATVSSELKATIVAMAKKYKWHTLGEVITKQAAASKETVTTPRKPMHQSYRKYDSDDDILDLTQSFGDVLTVADDDSDEDLCDRKIPTVKKIAKKQPNHHKIPSKSFHSSAAATVSSSSSSSPDNNIAFKPNTKSKKLLDMRNDITTQLYLQYNQMAFGGQLPMDLSIVWSKRLTSTAGLTKMSVQASTGTKQGEIILSEKVVDNVFRLKTTLLHEMCHAAAWFIDSTRKPPHGPSFWKWAGILHLETTNCLLSYLSSAYRDYPLPYPFLCPLPHLLTYKPPFICPRHTMPPPQPSVLRIFQELWLPPVITTRSTNPSSLNASNVRLYMVDIGNHTTHVMSPNHADLHSCPSCTYHFITILIHVHPHPYST